ncbi:serine hydrolase [Brachybacterium endophyticum]|uniref:Serine hydrolase n=1 Tax=Brachybacterium endophyticum TaxID=2182385 RepID=A0A2U2RNB8_9MICO|nr:serine hydrolase [Brachybacterium endophyticum]PWH07362.1 serine hydrolase [Brachybacterium endophyticum]
MEPATPPTSTQTSSTPPSSARPSAIPTAAAPTGTAVCWCLLDGAGREASAHDPERPLYAASTIKLHVLLAALHVADDGDLDLEAEVPSTRSFTGADGRPFTLAGDHLDPTHPAEGEGIRVADLLARMIDRSSNEATDHVLSLVGPGTVTEVIGDLGLEATRVERMIGDAAALEQGLTNETCARDLARTLRVLVRGDGLSASARELARAALAAQQIRIVATGLRPEVPSFSKSGWVEGYRHDVAALGDPEGGDVRVLAVMTGGLAQARADAEITRLARALLPDLAG